MLYHENSGNQRSSGYICAFSANGGAARGRRVTPKQRALDTADLAQCQREAVLPRVGADHLSMSEALTEPLSPP